MYTGKNFSLMRMSERRVVEGREQERTGNVYMYEAGPEAGGGAASRAAGVARVRNIGLNVMGILTRR